MKKLIITILFICTNIPLFPKDKFTSVQIIYSSLDYPTPLFYEPIYFDLGSCEDKCDTLEIKDAQDIDKLVNSLKNLNPSKHLTLDTRGKLIFKRPFAKMDNIWVYWGIADIQIGLNGKIFCMSQYFANTLDEIFYKYKNTYFFKK